MNVTRAHRVLDRDARGKRTRSARLSLPASEPAADLLPSLKFQLGIIDDFLHDEEGSGLADAGKRDEPCRRLKSAISRTLISRK
jgi:hypothetical protein